MKVKVKVKDKLILLDKFLDIVFMVRTNTKKIKIQAYIKIIFSYYLSILCIEKVRQDYIEVKYFWFCFKVIQDKDINIIKCDTKNMIVGICLNNLFFDIFAS